MTSEWKGTRGELWTVEGFIMTGDTQDPVEVAYVRANNGMEELLIAAWNAILAITPPGADPVKVAEAMPEIINQMLDELRKHAVLRWKGTRLYADCEKAGLL